MHIPKFYARPNGLRIILNNPNIKVLEVDYDPESAYRRGTSLAHSLYGGGGTLTILSGAISLTNSSSRTL